MVNPNNSQCFIIYMNSISTPCIYFGVEGFVQKSESWNFVGKVLIGKRIAVKIYLGA
jgi:hypothetical protein